LSEENGVQFGHVEILRDYDNMQEHSNKADLLATAIKQIAVNHINETAEKLA
jgi:hypothetical protein